MKVIHLCTETKYGAGLGTLQLSNDMTRMGIDSKVLTIEDFPIQMSMMCRIANKLREYTKKIKSIYCCNKNTNYKSFGLFSEGTGNHDILSNSYVKDADIIYLHWINRFLSIEKIGQLLRQRKKIVWIMRDMWPMTGGCHHSFDCDLYCTHCTNCPSLQNDIYNISYKIFERKLKNFVDFPNLAICGISNWISDCAKKSKLFHNNSIFTIHNSMDANVFHPISKKIAREVLELPQEKKLLLFGAAEGTRNFYKGWNYLIKALSKLNSDYELVIFGEDYNQEVVDEINLKVHFMGRIFDKKILLSLIYSACDVFLSPTLAESFGKTIAEACLCCTPVVCFGVGGTKDIIKHLHTGYLAKYKDSDDFFKGIKWIFDNNNNNNIGFSARTNIIELCNYKTIINKHTEMWKEMGWIK